MGKLEALQQQLMTTKGIVWYVNALHIHSLHFSH